MKNWWTHNAVLKSQLFDLYNCVVMKYLLPSMHVKKWVDKCDALYCCCDVHKLKKYFFRYDNLVKYNVKLQIQDVFRLVKKWPKNQSKLVFNRPIVNFWHQLNLIIICRRIFVDLNFYFWGKVEKVWKSHYFFNEIRLLNIKRDDWRCIIISELEHILIS